MTPIDRRQLLCGGCAAVTLVACSGRNFATDDPLPGTDADTGGNGGNDPGPNLVDPLANPSYPCDQPIVAGGDGWKGFELANKPELAAVGGQIPAATPSGLQYLVAHVEEGCYVAIARKCTHQGALVHYDPVKGRFQCDMHGSLFDVDGSVLGGRRPSPSRCSSPVGTETPSGSASQSRGAPSPPID